MIERLMFVANQAGMLQSALQFAAGRLDKKSKVDQEEGRKIFLDCCRQAEEILFILREEAVSLAGGPGVPGINP